MAFVVNRAKQNRTVISDPGLLNGVLVFQPGVNILSDQDYSIVKDKPGFISEIDCGNMSVADAVIEERQPEVIFEEPTEQGIESLTKELSVKKAKQKIKELDSIEELEKILETDFRSGVKKAVENRIEELKAED